MKKWIQFVFAFLCIFSISIAFSGCFGNLGVQIKITLNEIDKVHVEYDDVVYVKDGDEIYAKSAVYSDRNEVFMKANLKNSFATNEDNEQKYVSFRWTNNEWQRADNDTIYSTWEANAHNYDAIHGSNANKKGPMTSQYIMNGYSYVDNPFLDGSEKLEQKQDESIMVGETLVDCIVWEYTYNGSNYYRAQFYFAKDSHVFLQEKSTTTRYGDVIVKQKATYYKTGESMQEVLESKNRTMPLGLDQFQ